MNPFNNKPPPNKLDTNLINALRRATNLLGECDASDKELEYFELDIEGVEAIIGDESESEQLIALSKSSY